MAEAERCSDFRQVAFSHKWKGILRLNVLSSAPSTSYSILNNYLKQHKFLFINIYIFMMLFCF